MLSVVFSLTFYSCICFWAHQSCSLSSSSLIFFCWISSMINISLVRLCSPLWLFLHHLLLSAYDQSLIWTSYCPPPLFTLSVFSCSDFMCYDLRPFPVLIFLSLPPSSYFISHGAALGSTRRTNNLMRADWDCSTRQGFPMRIVTAGPTQASFMSTRWRKRSVYFWQTFKCHHHLKR